MKKSISLNSGWKYRLHDVTSNSEFEQFYRVGFDDSNWEVVTVPHDSSIHQEFKERYLSGPRGGYANTDLCYYNRYFNLTEEEIGKRIALEFEGIYMNSYVYINGEFFAKYHYGYTAVTYDISSRVIAGENKISIFVDNEQQPGSRWYTGTGIYRPVNLYISEKLHLDQSEFAVRTSNVTKDSAEIEVSAKIFNDATKSNTYKLKVEIFDNEKALVDSLYIEGAISNKGNYEEIFTTKIKNPKLWSNKSPDMYSCKLTLTDETDILCDEIETNFGIRSIEFKPSLGFVINGEKEYLKGMCIHHDNGSIGACADPGAIRRKLQIVKDMGANAIRTAHNPEAKAFLDICDELGLYVMEEAFDEWKISKRPRVPGNLNYRQRIHAYAQYFDEWANIDLAAMVKRDRNHPCIVLWSIGNEILDLRQKEGEATTQMLCNTVKAHDRTRPITVACNGLAAINNTACPDIVDVCGYNYAESFYDDDHIRKPFRPIVGSETASANITRIRGKYDEFLKTNDGLDKKADEDPTVIGSRASLKASFERGETSIKAHKQRDFVAGHFIWTGVDYMGEAGPEIWPTIGAGCGAIDKALFPKDSYYFYQSIWKDEAVLHILPHWSFDDMDGKKIPVWCFTNCDEVEIFVNDISYGTKSSKDTENLHLEWDNVIYQKGEIKAVGKKDGKEYVEIVKSAGDCTDVDLQLDIVDLTLGELTYAKVSLLDKSNVVVPNKDQEVEFSCSGCLEFVSSDNGHQAYSKYMNKTVETLEGLARGIFRATSTGDGEVTVTTVCNGAKVQKTVKVIVK